MYGQDRYVLGEILQAYEEGYHQSLRDAFSVLGHQSNDTVIQRVKAGMLIDLQDPTLDTITTNDWTRYYYEHHDQIQYYPEWGAFLRNDLEIPNLPYAILDNYNEPSALISKARSIYNSINAKSLKKIVPTIESLSLPEIIYAKRILIDCLELLADSHSCEKMVPAYAAISAKLMTINDQYLHQKIDQIIREKLCSPKVHKSLLLHISHYKGESPIYSTLSEQLEIYRNSQFISHIKEQIYSQELNISSSYFDHKVDYYGKLLTALDLGNTIDEDEIIYLLFESESSKALYYLVSRWFIYAKAKHPRATELMDMVTSFIDSNIQINTPYGKAYKCNKNTIDLVAQKSILAFWINNYQNYEWNEDVNKFVNKNILKKDRRELVQLYKNLNGDNSEFALKSYWKLVHSDPILLAEVDKIYSKKLLNYNRNLPSRKYKYLLQLARLVHYCKTTGFEYRIDDTLKPLLSGLEEARSISDIIDLENRIIDNLNINNITAFEIWSIVNSGKEHVRYSATRISNIFYKNNLNRVIESGRHFNLFLKKSNLFKKFGDHGSSKYYLNKIADNITIHTKHLKYLRNEILDEDILSSIEYLINYNKKNAPTKNTIDFNDFIKSPSSVNSDEVRYINKANKHSLNKMISVFESKYSARDQFTILEWVQIHTPKELLPFIVSLKSREYSVEGDDNVEIAVKEFANQILSAYINKGNLLVKNWPKEYIQVFQEIFEKDLAKVNNSEEVSIETINDIIKSKFYTSGTRSVILNALPKVKPARNITACVLPSQLSLQELQNLLPKIKSKNALDYLLKITDVENNDELVSFLITHIGDKGISIAGRFFNGLFKKQWFTDYIDSPTTSVDLKIKVQWVLTNYWENENGLSSFEEEQTVLNIIKIELAGKSLKERLELILGSFVDNEVKLQTIKKIIHQIDYESISLVLDYYDQIIEIGGLELFKFITDDFGIPLIDLSDRVIIKQLSKDLKELSEEELYFKYLNKIGVYLKDSDDQLNINKAYSILTEDLVRPFVGTGGAVRDIYVFGTIKLLEKEFNKTLGFHPKLNESQSFYKYTSKKRAVAWAEELSSLMPSN